MGKNRLLQCALAMTVMITPVVSARFFELPQLPQEWKYGNVLITRQAATSNKTAGFVFPLVTQDLLHLQGLSF